ncbi:MAG: M48 family metalloprotease [Alphaproteobacteria bacterium]|nr:M48 family metalloprotease [Alphaproteobacteria bacterium]
MNGKIVLSIGLAVLAAACTGPKANLPTYGQPANVAATSAATDGIPNSVQRDGQFRQRDVEAIVARLSGAILQPDMCRVVDCPRSGGYAVVIVDEDTVNAATDGEIIYVATGLLDFVDNDGELAAVLSHEIAHGLLDHRSSKQQDAMLGAMLGTVVGAAVGVDASNLGANLGALTYSKEYEREADYVGMYIMARAGYGLRDAYTMWQRMAGISTSQGSFLDSHPAFTERLALVRATNDEIARKMQTGQTLVPAIN